MPNSNCGLLHLTLTAALALPLCGTASAEQVLSALPAEAALDLTKGFRAERLCLAPRELGSWVSMTFDDRQRIIVSHEGGGLYRITPSPLDSPQQPTTVERLSVKLGGAQGLLFADDKLYAVTRGLHRLEDTDSDGQFDAVDQLLDIPGRGEHGPHAVVRSQDKNWLYVIAGNATPLPAELTRRRVVNVPGAETYSKDSAQGWVIRVSPDGNQRELVCVGLRNSYGLAMSPHGELFTFDSDNEGYMNLPWYRPTNVYHIVSGADFGWRQGPRTFQSYYPDNLPPVLEVGPGSPTGMVFGAGSKFPDRYRRALFVSDWSYGRIYAIHLRANGASYQATQEFFLSGRPLAVTDVRFGADGAMYFITGGRGTQSALYRVRWAGDGDAGKDAEEENNDAEEEGAIFRLRRRQLEVFHGVQDPRAVDSAWRHLRSADRSIRYAARVAIEHQDVGSWQQRAFEEPVMHSSVEAMLALARQADKSLRPRILKKLIFWSHAWFQLDPPDQLAILRAIDVVFQQMGVPEGELADQLLEIFDEEYPAEDGDVNRELIKLLVSLKAKGLAERTIAVLERTPSAMRQIHFLRELNRRGTELTDEQRRRLAATLDIDTIRDTAARDYKDVASIVNAMLKEIGIGAEPVPPKPRPLVRQWQLDELTPLLDATALAKGDTSNGRAVFRKANCHSCHRIGTTGGVLGPNLTTLASRFQPDDVLEAIVHPDKVVADQYRTTTFLKTNGERFTGQIVNLSKGNIQVRLDPLRPFPRVSIPESDIQSMKLSDKSLMPDGLLNYLTREEIRDLLAYLLRR